MYKHKFYVSLTIQYDPKEISMQGEYSTTMHPFSASSDRSLAQGRKISLLVHILHSISYIFQWDTCTIGTQSGGAVGCVTALQAGRWLLRLT